MNDETRKNLIDILQAPEEIQDFVLGMDFEAYQSTPVTMRAVERDFEIIGRLSIESRIQTANYWRRFPSTTGLSDSGTS
jgi:uncharacterized protein with HEPN domain